jgi:hypothetical protein
MRRSVELNAERGTYSNLQFAIIYFCLTFASYTAYADSPPAVPVDGRAFSADIASIVKGLIAFQTAEQKRQLPLGDLVSWGACPEVKRGPIVVLADGGFLAADIASADKDTLTADSESFGRIKFPYDALAGIIFRLPSVPKDRDALIDRIVRQEGDSDRLMLDNGDELAGLVENIGEDAVSLKANVGEVNVEISRITAIFFNPALRRKPSETGERIWLGFGDGSRLLASNIQIDNAGLKCSVSGQDISTTPKNLVFLQPLSGRAVYLSDLKPSDYRFVPYLDLTWPYRPDRDVTGCWLRAGGSLYIKGLGMHSAARLIYTLDQPYNRFQAELAVDDSAAGGGSVRFLVFVDGREKFTSETIRGGMKPVPISVDIAGAKQIDLVVDYADRADVLDHADWLNARLIK